MPQVAYSNPDAGRIVRGMDGNDAFLPAPLPPAIEWNPDLAASLSLADGIIGELSGVGRLLPSPDLLIRPYAQREAVQSSRIEGTQATLDDLLRAGLERDDSSVSSEVTEVSNYVRAMDLGLELLRRRPVISLNLVLEMHRTLMTDIPGERGRGAMPGRFRTTQNWIGTPGSTPRTATYVPPPPELVQDCLTDWERFVNEPSTIPDLIRAALIHEQFEAIHPFNDGNGRIGRLLVTLFLVERGRLSQPLLYLSEYIEANRSGYYESLQRVRTNGDWTNWLLFFLEGVQITGRRALDQTTRLIEFRENWLRQLRELPRQVALIDPLLSNPYITVARAADLLDVTAPTARLTIGSMETAGLLVQVPSKARRRLYVAAQILEIISADDGRR